MDYLQKIIIDFEIHSVDGIKECFKNGIDPNLIHNGKPLIYEMINMYARGPMFKKCIEAFVVYGLEFDDKVLLAVLLDDTGSLETHLTQNKEALNKKYSLDCTFTPLYNASLLHICAEYNHLACAEVLVKHGANINEKAGTDEYGFGGQTPIFHTVNQNLNQSADMLNYLLSESADLTITVKGLIWGKGYEWETLIPSVNPISYAMMGLLPQMHRNEITISKTVSLLLKNAYGIDYTAKNVPCAYLKK
ncbi:MAG TPA: hypothetical protein PLP23_13890 [Panacibacter sp.]|nr:hypothetical protein [Panacibacter sp.]